MENQKIYLGLDIGTDSVGYAVTDTAYSLLKFKGKPAWGVTLFDEASQQDERRAFRTARRRLDRRQQRVLLLQELFAKEIAKKDERFFIRLKESFLYRDDVGYKFTLFNDADFTDRDYYKLYPTIHHLIYELMTSTEPHDVRLVYLACAWLTAHRGHFLFNIDKANIDAIRDFNNIYAEFLSFFTDEKTCAAPWDCGDIAKLEKILKTKASVTVKYKNLCDLLYDGKKPSKQADGEFPYSRETITRLLAGGTCKIKDLYQNDEYEDYGSFSLSDDDDKFAEISANIGDDYPLIEQLRKIYDWSVLADILGESDSGLISEAKVREYETHKKDLKTLRYFIRKYVPGKYREVFREIGKDNYAAYAYHSDEPDTSALKKVNAELFSKYILGIIKDIQVEDGDRELFEDMKTRLELRAFMPKQKNTNNRVIPYQLYWVELDKILKNAEGYLPFLGEKDADGLTVSEKISSVFLFRIPYFVGPLNSHSENSWFVRKAEGRIYPWNIETKVDFDKSEEAFIGRMTNTCTYLPGKSVLPKDSILYQKYTVLNELNNLKVNGQKIPVELKQQIFDELFCAHKKVSKKQLIDFMICKGAIRKGEEDTVTGIDIKINSSCSSYCAFGRLLSSGALTENDVERIIERAAFASEKTRFAKWLAAEYPSLPADDKKYISRLKIKDFGRLSREFLCEIQGTDKATGEVMTIIEALWNTQNNLMELRSDKFTFKDACDDFAAEYYAVNKPTLEKRLDDMYIPNGVKRSIYRTLDIVGDVVKAFGKPEKIFIEMTRGATEEQKHKRTKTRKEQILELYRQCRDEDVKELTRQLEAMGEYVDNRLQSDRLFLYYMQLGKCMYTGKPIELDKLFDSEMYDIDHIYPQAVVKDDSIINNKVLVLSTENGKKSDRYPLDEDIRTRMGGIWQYYKDAGLISEEKFKRLTRTTPFTEDERFGFISRQLTQTSQSTKAVAAILKEKYPQTEIVYSKAGLVSEFRHEFDILKSRLFNDLHHAADAYLNIVVGNVYNMKFTRRWFDVNKNYSVKIEAIFEHPVVCGGETVWDGKNMLAKVKATAVKNTAHLTVYSYRRHHGQNGGLFDQNPKSKASGLIPLKTTIQGYELPTEKYGGYNGATTASFVLVSCKKGKKKDLLFFPVDLLFADKFFGSKEFAVSHIQKAIGNEKISDFDFPLGLREIKINTVLSLDGFRVCLDSGSIKDGRVGIEPIVPFCAEYSVGKYIKHLESFVNKVTDAEKEKRTYYYSQKHDVVESEANIRLYDCYIKKLSQSIYSKRPKADELYSAMVSFRDSFINLDIKAQSKQLLEIHKAFGRYKEISLKEIGGVSCGYKTRQNVFLSNWKKNYTDIRIIDSSASGLWEKASDNLLELL